MTPYVKVPGELVRIFLHSLLWPQRSLLYGFPPHCTKQSVFLTLQLDRICQNRVSYLSAMLFYRFLTGLLHGNHCYFKYLIDSIAVSLFADILIELTNTETAAVTL